MQNDSSFCGSPMLFLLGGYKMDQLIYLLTRTDWFWHLLSVLTATLIGSKELI